MAMGKTDQGPLQKPAAHGDNSKAGHDGDIGLPHQKTPLPPDQPLRADKDDRIQAQRRAGERIK